MTFQIFQMTSDKLTGWGISLFICRWLLAEPLFIPRAYVECRDLCSDAAYLWASSSRDSHEAGTSIRDAQQRRDRSFSLCWWRLRWSTHRSSQQSDSHPPHAQRRYRCLLGGWFLRVKPFPISILWGFYFCIFCDLASKVAGEKVELQAGKAVCFQDGGQLRRMHLQCAKRPWSIWFDGCYGCSPVSTQTSGTQQISCASSKIFSVCICLNILEAGQLPT